MSCDRVLTRIMATMTVKKTTIIVLFVIENLRGTYDRDAASRRRRRGDRAL